MAQIKEGELRENKNAQQGVTPCGRHNFLTQIANYACE
jgi:hypothetical protein